VLDGGRVLEQGTYAELVAAGGWLATMVDAHGSHEQSDSPRGSSGAGGGGGDAKVEAAQPEAKTAEMVEGVAGAVLVKQEGRKEGAVTLRTYAAYFTAGGSKGLVLTMLLGGFLLPEACNQFTQFWLSAWSSDPEGSTLGYLGVYAAVGLGAIGLVLARAFVWAQIVVNASGTLHERLLVNVLRQPVAFFDTTPLGRILTRFASDIDQIDSAISSTMQESFEFAARGLFSIGVIVAIMPALAPPFAVTLLVYRKVANYYRRSSREIKRIDSTRRSPIFADFSQNLAGLVTIRAYGDEARFCAHNRELVQANLQVMFMNLSLGRWLGMRVDVLGALIILLVSLGCAWWRVTTSGGIVGLLVVNALACIRTLRMGVKMAVDVESQMTYVERVCEYAQLPPEPAATLAGDPAEPWPPLGGIAFAAASLRYRPGLPLALRDATFHAQPGHKVGICGRTGAGKSTLTSALFRLVELDGGSVAYDGIDLAGLGLRTVRRSLGAQPELIRLWRILADHRSLAAIIPQEPVIFTGTFRSNLDPFNEVAERRVNEVVELVQMGAWLRAQPLGLDAPIAEGGSNLSVGQRQLVCLARALLRRPKVLILDEATASVDYETDRLIQTTIRAEFEGTVLNIAHRLNTIMDADQILVLGAGAIVEAGHPAELLQAAGGELRRMVDELGPAALAHFLQIARGEMSVVDTLADTLAER
jgi:ATP-binding cassette subfamily C (CFTR/MRP) protein 1